MAVTVSPMGVLLLLARHGLLDSVDSACDFGSMEIDSRSPEDNPVFEAFFHARGRAFPDEFRDEESGRIYAIAGDFYRALGWSYNSYDIDGRFGSTVIDLNVDQIPPSEREKYSLTMNMGTAEHVFNQYNFFLQAHNLTKVGGLMIHSVPLHNHRSHGLYVYTPAFFFSLAHYNGYEVLGSWQSGKPVRTNYRSCFDRPEGNRVLLITVMRRLRPGEFALPLQVNEPMWPGAQAEERYGAFAHQPLEAFRPSSGLPERFFIELPGVTFHEGGMPTAPRSERPRRGSERPRRGSTRSRRGVAFARALVREPRAMLARQVRRLQRV